MKMNRMTKTWVALGAALVGIASAAEAQAALLFSAYSTTAPAAGTGTTSTPNTQLGTGVTLASTGATRITGFDLTLRNGTGQTIAGTFRATVWVWNTQNAGPYSDSNPVFSDLAATRSLNITGSTLDTGFFRRYQHATNPGVDPFWTLSTPFEVTDPNIGVTVTWSFSTDGTTFQTMDQFSQYLHVNAPPEVGSNPNTHGYFRNANGESDGNFVSGLRTIGNSDATLMIRIYGEPIPEPSSAIALGAPAALLMVRRRRA